MENVLRVLGGDCVFGENRIGRSIGFEENLSEDEVRKIEVADEILKVAVPAIAIDMAVWEKA